MKNISYSINLSTKSILLAILVILSFISADTPGLSPNSPYYSMSKNGVVSFESMFNY